MLSETVRHLSFKMLNQADYILILYLNHHNTLLPNIGKGQTARVPEIMQPVDCILSTQSRGGGAKTVQGAAGAKPSIICLSLPDQIPGYASDKKNNEKMLNDWKRRFLLQKSTNL